MICSHCHYDHILGIEDFTRHPRCGIWASSFDKSFLSLDDLPEHSLCKENGVPTPKYTVTDWAHDNVPVRDLSSKDLGLVSFHTPGHTPDSPSIFDPQERVLFVGDTISGWDLIIFSHEGNLVTYSQTMGKLSKLVRAWNEDASKRRVTIASGHCNDVADAASLIVDVSAFLLDVVDGNLELKREEERRGEVRQLFGREGGGPSVLLPKRLI